MKTYPELVRHAGNQKLFDAIEMSVISTLMGRPLHLHAEGLRGTGKTTIMRAARQALPTIPRIKGCLYNCDPEQPHCPAHRDLDPDEARALGVELISVPFLELSHSSKVGTAVGSIDLARLADPARPQAALLPGTIPQAHRGIIFVDEINRLADTSPELADVLLDVMGTKPGRVQIEETGLPTVELEVRASVWAASNPDEDPGPLEEVRKQLSDRFDLVVTMSRPDAARVVHDILTQGFEATFNGKSQDPARRADERVARALAEARGRLGDRAARAPRVKFPASLKDQLAEIYVQFSLESLRGVEALQTAAALFCILDGREEVTLSDLHRAAPLALGHRTDVATLARILDRLRPDVRREDGGSEQVAGPAARGQTGPPPGASQARSGQPENAPAAADPGDQDRSTLWHRLVDRFKLGFGAQGEGSPEVHGPGTASPRRLWPGLGEGTHEPYLPSADTRFHAPDPTRFPAVAPPLPARFVWQLSPAEILTPEDRPLR